MFFSFIVVKVIEGERVESVAGPLVELVVKLDPEKKIKAS